MIFVDTCILIYAIENTGSRTERARALLASNETFAISPLVMMEALVWPIRARNEPLVREFEQAFTEFTVIDLDLACFIRAAHLRADTPSLKTADAVHLAAAQLAGCTALWTNDQRLAAASAGLAVDVMSEAGPPTNPGSMSAVGGLL